jgi:hypothetical protein
MSGVRLTWRQPQLQTRQLHPLTSLSSKRFRRDANGLTICSLVEWNSVAAIVKREGVLPELRPPTDTVGGLGLQDCRGHRLRVTNLLPQ